MRNFDFDLNDVSSIEKLLLSLRDSDCRTDSVLKKRKYFVFLYDLMTLTKFLIALTNERNCLHSFDQSMNVCSRESTLILCLNLADLKTFVIKLRTIDFVFDKLIDQKIRVVIRKS